MSAVERVVVVVPARDEELLLGRCLARVRRAADRLAAERAAAGEPPVRVGVVVALDGCTDGSAGIAAAAGAAVVAGAWGTAGGARAAAATTADAVRGTWIASTDADSAVPAHWLTGHVAAAERGAELLLGTVEPDPRDLPAAVLSRWHARHRLEEDHPHAHAANLGVRADVYAACGGFPALPHGEESALAAAARARGHVVVATDRVRVRTSGRATGRVPHGFAGYLRALAAGTGPMTAGDGG